MDTPPSGTPAADDPQEPFIPDVESYSYSSDDGDGTLLEGQEREGMEGPHSAELKCFNPSFGGANKEQKKSMGGIYDTANDAENVFLPEGIHENTTIDGNKLNLITMEEDEQMLVDAPEIAPNSSTPIDGNVVDMAIQMNKETHVEVISPELDFGELKVVEKEEAKQDLNNVPNNDENGNHSNDENNKDDVFPELQHDGHQIDSDNDGIRLELKMEYSSDESDDKNKEIKENEHLATEVNSIKPGEDDNNNVLNSLKQQDTLIKNKEINSLSDGDGDDEVSINSSIEEKTGEEASNTTSQNKLDKLAPVKKDFLYLDSLRDYANKTFSSKNSTRSISSLYSSAELPFSPYSPLAIKKCTTELCTEVTKYLTRLNNKNMKTSLFDQNYTDSNDESDEMQKYLVSSPGMPGQYPITNVSKLNQQENVFEILENIFREGISFIKRTSKDKTETVFSISKVMNLIDNVLNICIDYEVQQKNKKEVNKIKDEDSDIEYSDSTSNKSNNDINSVNLAGENEERNVISKDKENDNNEDDNENNNNLQTDGKHSVKDYKKCVKRKQPCPMSLIDIYVESHLISILIELSLEPENKDCSILHCLTIDNILHLMKLDLDLNIPCLKETFTEPFNKNYHLSTRKSSLKSVMIVGTPLTHPNSCTDTKSTTPVTSDNTESKSELNEDECNNVLIIEHMYDYMKDYYKPNRDPKNVFKSHFSAIQLIKTIITSLAYTINMSVDDKETSNPALLKNADSNFILLGCETKTLKEHPEFEDGPYPNITSLLIKLIEFTQMDKSLEDQCFTNVSGGSGMFKSFPIILGQPKTNNYRNNDDTDDMDEKDKIKILYNNDEDSDDELIDDDGDDDDDDDPDFIINSEEDKEEKKKPFDSSDSDSNDMNYIDDQSYSSSSEYTSSDEIGMHSRSDSDEQFGSKTLENFLKMRKETNNSQDSTKLHSEIINNNDNNDNDNDNNRKNIIDNNKINNNETNSYNNEQQNERVENNNGLTMQSEFINNKKKKDKKSLENKLETHTEEIPRLEDWMNEDEIEQNIETKLSNSEKSLDDDMDNLDPAEIDKNINEYIHGSARLITPSGSTDDLSSSTDESNNSNMSQLGNKIGGLIREEPRQDSQNKNVCVLPVVEVHNTEAIPKNISESQNGKTEIDELNLNDNNNNLSIPK